MPEQIINQHGRLKILGRMSFIYFKLSIRLLVSLHISYVPNGVANLGVASMETQRAHGQF